MNSGLMLRVVGLRLHAQLPCYSLFKRKELEKKKERREEKDQNNNKTTQPAPEPRRVIIRLMGPVVKGVPSVPGRDF